VLSKHSKLACDLLLLLLLLLLLDKSRR